MCAFWIRGLFATTAFPIAISFAPVARANSPAQSKPSPADFAKAAKTLEKSGSLSDLARAISWMKSWMKKRSAMRSAGRRRCAALLTRCRRVLCQPVDQADDEVIHEPRGRRCDDESDARAETLRSRAGSRWSAEAPARIAQLFQDLEDRVHSRPRRLAVIRCATKRCNLAIAKARIIGSMIPLFASVANCERGGIRSTTSWFTRNSVRPRLATRRCLRRQR